MHNHRRTLALLLTLIAGCAVSCQAASTPVKVKLRRGTEGLPAGTEVEVAAVNPNVSLVLLSQGKPVNVPNIDFDDFVLCAETFGEARADAKVFYMLTAYCAPIRPDLARKYAVRALKLDSTFKGDVNKRVNELCDPTAAAHKKLLATSWYDPPEEPKTGPRAHLLDVVRQKPLNRAELKKAYLDLQEARVFSEAKLPPPPPRTSLTAVERAALENGDVNGEQAFEKLNAEDGKALKEWFAASPAFRERFLLALEPGADFYQNAARVALKIRAANSKEVTAFEALLVAFATTWDNPKELRAVDVGIPELFQKPAPTCKPEEAFAWYVKNQARLCPWFQKTPWRLLAYVAADTGSISERDWALQTYKFSPTLGKVYADIQYDNSKLQDMIGKLAGRPYTLANLKTYGGVCRDQAFYARSVCRYFGLPAYWASGMGKSGGMGHAWVGWVLQSPSGGYQLSDYGRYTEDRFFTARVVHPRTGEAMLDYILGLEARGLSDEKAYNDADLLYRVFQEVGAYLEPKAAYELLIDAVRANAYHREAWLAISEGTATGAIPQSTAAAQWEYLTSKFKDYPDFTLEVLGRFARMFKDVESGYNMFEATAKMYLSMKREDLTARLRLEQIEMCLTAERNDIAFSTAIKGAQECANTGKEGADLARKMIELAHDPAQKKQATDALKQIVARTPKKRVDEPNEYWLELARLLHETYKSQGDEAAATRLDAEITAVLSGTKR